MRPLFLLAASLAFAPPAAAQPLTAAERAAVDALVTRTLAETAVPSASIALVRDGRIVLAKAYGRASPAVPVARADLPYQIASNSKQFTAMALLALENDGKLDLDDKVAKWLPGIGGGERIALRQLLSHTAGLRDYWPQDYLIPAMRSPVAPPDIVDRWARQPLDYEPGTRRQYSNTGYVVAGLIAEKAAGMPLMTYLRRRVLAPLGIGAVQIDDSNTPAFPAGHHRHVIGPVRVATPPARGWLFAAGDLSMTATDLARWNIARLERRLFPAGDWAEQERPVQLADGTSTGYGLGVAVGVADGRRFINHGGESVGFLSQNTVYPDDRASITVLTNADFGHIEGKLTDALAAILLPRAAPVDAGEPDRAADARTLFAALAAGRPDPATLTANARDYFNPTTRADYRASLAPLGPVTSITLLGTPRRRGGFVHRRFRIVAGGRAFTANSFAEPGARGRWEQFIVSPE